MLHTHAHGHHHRTGVRRITAMTAVVGTLVALLIGLFGAPPAAASPIDPDAVTTLEIHKFEQPDGGTATANGLPQDTSGLTPVAGATFTATLVPGIDLATNAGQQQANALSVAEAIALIAGEPASASDVTDAAGHATLTPLAVGLYYVQETDTPAGYVGSSPFLVALPLTHPTELNSWLTTVHVYPKDARALISLSVIDQDAVKIGDTVHWTSHSSIPNHADISGYRVEQVIVPSLELVGPAGDITADVRVSLTCDGCPELVEGVDFTIGYDETAQIITVDFLEPGLAKLEEAIAGDPTAQVRIDYDTIVHAEGIHVNEAILYPSAAAIEAGRGVDDTATTKWGPLSVIVHEHGNPDNLIPGARFKLFLTEEDALAGRNPIIVDGVGEWTTDEQGRLIINGLRFSGFVNDLERDTGDPLYRYFWAAPTFVPEGWTWHRDQPLRGSVNSEIEYQTLIFEVVKFDEAGDLPRTGAQLAGVGVLGAALLGFGMLLLLRRRSGGEAAEHSAR